MTIEVVGVAQSQSHSHTYTLAHTRTLVHTQTKQSDAGGRVPAMETGSS